MAEQSFDVVIIGGGPGGYVAAIRAAQLGLKAACIEMRGKLGGTCLNVGCIPSKALLESSHLYEEAAHDFDAHGIAMDALRLDLARMMTRKDKVVEGLTGGIEMLFRKHKVAYLKGRGALAGKGRVRFTSADGKSEEIAAGNVIIATGSEVMPLSGVEIDEKRIVSSTGALALPAVPKSMVVIGGGYIGLEMGTVWRRLGAEVTVVEFLDRIVPGMDGEIARQMQRSLAKQGIKFRLGTRVTAAKASKSGVELTLEPAKGGDQESLAAEVVLVSIGRRPFTAGLGLEDAGVALDERGRIKVDRAFRTAAPGVFAVGDVIAGPMLAHKAMDEGAACAEIIAGQKPHINYDAIPGVVYTWPEAASVGRTEEELKAAGIEYRVGKFPFAATPRARTSGGSTEGFVKLLADAKTDRLLGAHIIGPDAGTLIHEIVLALEFSASAQDVALVCHAHPTLNEAVKEAALAVAGHPLHI
ncbi:MAG: dihydrolipoyl dehydrogenase [Alphaproteobacteria bacterium]|nr:dihydrolipoyl dehydrogenase [Alphaproteobacteria bacterium]